MFFFYIAGYHLLQSLLHDEFDSKTKIEEKLMKNQKDVLHEITLLKNKINELEISLEQAEFRVPKTFPNIKFLNYKDRKRILVKLFMHSVFSIVLLNFRNDFSVGNRRSRVRWFTSCRLSDETRT